MPVTHRWFCDYTVCEPCFKLRSDGNICPICNSAYKDYTPNMIQVCWGVGVYLLGLVSS